MGCAGAYWYFFRTGPVFEIGETRFLLDVDRAVARAKLLNKPVLLYFCASGFEGSRWFESGVLRTPAISDRLEGFECAAAFVDQVPFIDAKNGKEMAERNGKLQEDILQDVSLPAFAVVRPDFDHLHPLERGNLIAVSSGMLGTSGFTQFLESALAKWDELRQSEKQRRDR